MLALYKKPPEGGFFVSGAYPPLIPGRTMAPD